MLQYPTFFNSPRKRMMISLLCDGFVELKTIFHPVPTCSMCLGIVTSPIQSSKNTISSVTHAAGDQLLKYLSSLNFLEVGM